MKKRSFLPLIVLSRELQRRKVYPAVAAYAVTVWILLQIAEVTFEPLGLPHSLMVGLIALAIGGFPVVLALSWHFDIRLTGPQRQAKSLAKESETDTLPSIAVLPFVDMSPDKDQGYFCEGVAEEILNALTKIRRLRVAARISSFQFQGVENDVRKIGEILGVRAILEGSVRKSGNRLRITAQLIKVADGYHIWSKSFDEELKDIFSIQDEIATSIAESLLDTLRPVSTASSSDILAYEYYLRGRHFFNRFRKMDIDFARQMFRRAIDIDPDFALAWSGYADCYSFLIMYVDPNEEFRLEATKASERALQIDPDLAEAHASRGLAYLICEDYELAESEFNIALDLNPSSYEAYYYYGRTRFHQGDMEKAAELFEKAAEVNPDDYQSRLLRVQVLSGLGRLEEAEKEAIQGIAAAERHLEWNPDDARAFHLGAGSLILLGDIDRAERWLQRALAIDPDDSVVLYNVACNYANIGNIELALDYLEQAIANGTVSASWMKNDEDLASLRGQTRYTALLNGLAYRQA